MRVAALMVYASIAQLAERRTVNAYVEGPSPSRGAINNAGSSRGQEARLITWKSCGSNPTPARHIILTASTWCVLGNAKLSKTKLTKGSVI